MGYIGRYIILGPKQYNKKSIAIFFGALYQPIFGYQLMYQINIGQYGPNFIDRTSLNVEADSGPIFFCLNLFAFVFLVMECV